MPPLPTSPLGVVVPHSVLVSRKVCVKLFLDLACPFSGRLFSTVQKVLPEYQSMEVEWAVHHVPQPWHPQSTYLHEAALAVHAVTPAAYVQFCTLVWDKREARFSDEATLDLSRSQIYDELADLAAVAGADRAGVREKLALTGPGDKGTSVIQDVKFAVQFHRKRGIHVTPTVFINGIEATTISSSSTVDDWKELLDKTLAP